jgi:hypothetical protein
MQQAIIFDDIKGSEIFNMLKASLKQLIPEKKYTVKIQPTVDKDAII